MDVARRTPSFRIPAPQGNRGDYFAHYDDHKPLPTRRRNNRRYVTLIVSGACFLFVVGMVGWFLIQAGMFEETAKPVTAAKSARQVSSKESVLIGPIFTGFDKHKQPYSVGAKSARRDEDNPSAVFLNEVRGELKLRRSGDRILMMAAEGLYNSDAKLLDLSGNVRMISTGKYSAKTNAAKVNMPEKRLRSVTPVNVVFSSGTIDANGVELWDAGERILFFNGVKLHIGPQDKEGSN